jgi:hypothetical protein
MDGEREGAGHARTSPKSICLFYCELCSKNIFPSEKGGFGLEVIFDGIFKTGVNGSVF